MYIQIRVHKIHKTRATNNSHWRKHNKTTLIYWKLNVNTENAHWNSTTGRQSNVDLIRSRIDHNFIVLECAVNIVNCAAEDVISLDLQLD